MITNRYRYFIDIIPVYRCLVRLFNYEHIVKSVKPVIFPCFNIKYMFVLHKKCMFFKLKVKHKLSV